MLFAGRAHCRPLCTPTIRTPGDTNFITFASLQANPGQKQYTKRFILAHSFRLTVYICLTPCTWSARHGSGSRWGEVSHLIVDKQKRETSTLLRHAPSDLLPPGGPHLKFPQLSRTAPPDGTKNSALKSVVVSSHFNHNTTTGECL